MYLAVHRTSPKALTSASFFILFRKMMKTLSLIFLGIIIFSYLNQFCNVLPWPLCRSWEQWFWVYNRWSLCWSSWLLWRRPVAVTHPIRSSDHDNNYRRIISEPGSQVLNIKCISWMKVPRPLPSFFGLKKYFIWEKHWQMILTLFTLTWTLRKRDT